MHTSDVHLGCTYSGPMARQALAAVVDAALEERADALLLAGDIFDYNRVRDDEVRFFLGQLGRFPQPSIILPGNHDCYIDGSVYRRPLFADAPAQVHVLDDQSDTLCLFPDLDLEVWGRATVDHHRGFRPLTEEPPREGNRWRVGLGHGHFEEEVGSEARSSPIFPEDIAALACDYVALGHWDRFADVSQGEVRACYSGAPHWDGRKRGLASALLIRLDPEEGVQVTRRPLGAVGHSASSGLSTPVNTPVSF
jgi:DNA repair exonuclease SbcCD nuclease subunit